MKPRRKEKFRHTAGVCEPRSIKGEPVLHSDLAGELAEKKKEVESRIASHLEQILKQQTATKKPSAKLASRALGLNHQNDPQIPSSAFGVNRERSH